MSDLAQFEQELLRRNAALEERAAASIARAKAVVEGQVASASGVAALVAKSELAFAAPAASPPPPRRTAADFIREAEAYYDEEEENHPPIPPRDVSFDEYDDERDERDDAADAYDDLGGGASPTRAGRVLAPASRASPARRSRELRAAGTVFQPPADSAEVEASEDNYGRLAKARIRALQDELTAQARELRDAHARLKDRDAELKASLTEKVAAAKQIKSLKSIVEREKLERLDAEARAEAKEREAKEARRDAEAAARARKADARETKSRDVRLNRALEEVDKYRHMLAEARDAGKGGDATVRRERDELRGEARRLERQKTELVAAFKKQMKLVDVLKKQKIHLEAARAVQFTEEEFMRVLEEEERRE